jgi:hypothetical protein
VVKRWSSAAARRIIAAAGGGLNVPDAVEVVTAGLRDRLAGPPTDLASVAERVGVSGWQAENLPVAGELRRDGDAFVIAYASGMPVGRRRFTIAHELGHAFFESTGPGCPRVGEELERICDRFAAALLLPAAQLNEDLADWSPRHAIELAKRYEVSLSALLLRAGEVGDRHGAVLDVEGHVIVATAMVASRRDAHPEELARLAARASAGLNNVAVLPRNQRWNGQWQLTGQPIAGGQRMLVTGIPVDAEGLMIRRRLTLLPSVVRCG